MYRSHEQQKNNMYMHRVQQVEKASFTPLVFSTTGGMGVEATKFYKRVVEIPREAGNACVLCEKFRRNSQCVNGPPRHINCRVNARYNKKSSDTRRVPAHDAQTDMNYCA